MKNETSKVLQKKKILRDEILKKRMALSSEYVKICSERVCNKITETDEYKTSTDICCYMSIKNEIDLQLLIKKAFADEKRVWLPRIIEKNMDFYQYKPDTPLVKGTYGISEPDSEKVLIPNDTTLIIMPGAVFSKSNDRIGYGGGFYDRYLEKHNGVITIAVAYDFQIVEDIPALMHDKKPSMIITDI